MFAILLIVVSVLRMIASAVTPSSISSSACYENSRDYYPYLSTRTAYELVHGRLTRLENTCTPIQIWMLARHGTRYPGEEVMKKMQTMTEFRNEILRNHERGDGNLCNLDLDKLRDWRQNPNLRLENAEVLSEQGEKDLRQLAERLKGVFSELLDERKSVPGDFIFRSTDTQRTKASMEAFANGLFGNDRRSVQIEEPPVNDTLLAPRYVCPAWVATYEIDHVNAERDKFTEGPEVKTVLEDIGMRLGFNKPLDFDKLKMLYDACRFETAWHPHLQSPWCLLFRGDELKILEYREDLDYYYFAGPARPMSAKLGCQTLSDMFKHFEASTSGDQNKQPKGIFYFAHTVTLQNLMAALKIAVEPKPLLSSNYAKMHERDYRTSLLGPFATNVVAVLYRCNGSTTPYKVTMYTAEKSVKMTGCSDEACDWKFFEQKFAPDVEKCSMDFCFEKVSDSAMNSSYSIVLITVALIARFVLT